MTTPRHSILAAIVAGGIPPAPPHPDAEILALGVELDAAYAVYLAFRPEELAAERAPWDVREQIVAEAMALRELADIPAETLYRLPPPTTLAGVAVLVRALAGFHCDVFDGPADGMEDIGERMLRLTLEAVLALAGVDRLGRSIGGDR